MFCWTQKSCQPSIQSKQPLFVMQKNVFIVMCAMFVSSRTWYGTESVDPSPGVSSGWLCSLILLTLQAGANRIEPLSSPACRKRRLRRQDGNRLLRLYHQWWKSKIQEPPRVAREVARPIRINYFQKITRFINRLWRYIATCADVP